MQEMLLTEYDEVKTMELFKEEGREEGFLKALIELVRDGDISKERAASRAQMTISEFEAEMKKAQ